MPSAMPANIANSMFQLGPKTAALIKPMKTPARQFVARSPNTK